MLLFLTASVLFFVAGAEKSPLFLRRAAHIHLTALMFSESAGVIAVWFVITLIWGRIYCSSVCPVGAITDFIEHAHRSLSKHPKPRHYCNPPRFRHHIFIVYIVCLALGLGAVPLLLEPWQIFSNIAVVFGSDHSARLWAQYGYGAFAGLTAGILSILLLVLYSLLRGHAFCNEVCPMGTAMSYVSRFSAFAIKIDPDKCTCCGKCEEICKANCIKTVERHVDNSRCVRCLDCLDICPEDALSFTINDKRPLTPLWRRTTRKT